ncbi:MAG: hypothetical protein CNCCGFBP_02093 [Fimbriimonadaceae bacterium]|nr:hypothetical protein [Fimbriimonadaceae bacterium]
MKSRLLLAGSVLFSVAGLANASGVLLWNEWAYTDNWTPAIAAAGYSKTDAVSEADFVTKVGLGGWDAVVMNIGSSSGYASADAAITAWIVGGGRAIASNWDISDNALANAFGAAYTGNTNDPSIPHSGTGIFAGVANNPVMTANPGYGIFAMGLSATTGTVVASFSGGDGAIVQGNGGRTFYNGFLLDACADNADYVTIFKNELLAVPEPTSMVALGLGAAAVLRRRRKA